jgi:putative membrane protein
MAVGWLFIIGLVLLAVWAFAGRSDGAHPPTPLEVLETRFARGEITAEEYRDRRDVLIQSRSRKRR